MVVNRCAPKVTPRTSLLYITERVGGRGGPLYGFGQGANGVVPGWQEANHDFGADAYNPYAPMVLSMSASNITDGTTVQLFREGTALPMTITGSYYHPIGTLNWWLGHIEEDTSFGFEGRYSYVAIYTRALTASDLFNLHGFLNRKYNFRPFLL